jgi:hypothetical protein
MPSAPLAVASYTLVTPAEWWRIPLQPEERRHASVGQLVDRQFRGLDDQPLLKRDTAQRLHATADEAAQQAGGLELFVSTQLIAGVPLGVSLLVSMLPAGTMSSLDRLHDALATGGPSGDTGGGPSNRPSDGVPELARETIAAGPVLRRRRTVRPGADDPGEELPRSVVDYWVPVPGDGGLLQLSFSTPMPEQLAAAMVELFDAVTASLRWKQPSSEGNPR